MKWTAEQDARLTHHLSKGLSFGEVARILTHEFQFPVSRNAVLGRAHRVKINSGYIAKRMPRKQPTRRKPGLPLLPRVPAETAQLSTLSASPSPPAIQRERLPPRYQKRATCTFPMESGKPCGEPSNGSWCEYHKKIVFQPKEKK